MRLFLSILLLAQLASGATRTVDDSGGADHTTIGAAVTAGSDGDIIVVAPGNYPERVVVTKHGLTFIGDFNNKGTGTVCRGFEGNNIHRLKIMGFEMTHTSTANRAGIHLQGVCSNAVIIRNYIHDVSREGIKLENAAYAIVRDNEIYWVNHPGSTQIPDAGITTDLNSHHCLIEYNHIRRAGDYHNVYGQFQVVRNQWLHDTDIPAYWTDNGLHPDFFQPGSDGAQTFTRHQVMEHNFMGDNPSDQGHGLIQQDNSGFGDTNITFWGNVLYAIGGGGAGGFGTEYVQMMNNTFFNNLSIPSPPQGNLINWYRDNPDGSMGGLLINTLIAFVAPGHDDIYLDVDNEVLITNNWGYAANSESSYLGTTNPLFADTNALDFRLQSSSPVRGIGTHITTITNANGSGTSFGVVAKHRLKDGWGICEGDLISFPGGGTARITAVDYETHIITVASSISWTNGQRIYRGPRGYQADLGAYPFGAVFLTAAAYSVNSGTATVTTTGDARKIWKYRNALQVAEDYDTPFTFADHQAGDVYVAGALYAQQNQTVLAVEEAGGSGNIVTTISGPGQSSSRPVYGN